MPDAELGTDLFMYLVDSSAMSDHAIQEPQANTLRCPLDENSSRLGTSFHKTALRGKHPTGRTSPISNKEITIEMKTQRGTG